VNRLAHAEQRQSQGFADVSTTTVGTGTVTVGSGSTSKQITVDATNNTLSGLRDAINRSGAGVTASIINLGTGTTADYHLVLTGSRTGAENAITWNADLAGGTAPSWTTTTAATDASITVGTGETATTLTRGVNTINDVYPGLSITLKAADIGKPVTLTVTPDTDAVKQKIVDFVTQYNDVMDYVRKQFSFDSTTYQSGPLFGDFALQNVQQELRSGILQPIPGLPAAMNALSQIGFSSDTKDNLVLDEAKLTEALKADPAGVMKLFAAQGETTDYAVAFQGSSRLTKPTTGAGYTVRVDQGATRARVTAGAAQSGPLAADETLTVNGVAISLTAGMTEQQVLDTINAQTARTGVTASRTGADGAGAGGYLTFTRTSWGSAGHITVQSTASVSGGAGTSGIGNVQVTETSAAGESGTGSGAAGKDVAGAFGVTVNGVITWEAATGTGQDLTGNSGNANTDGLRLRVTATTTGEHGTVVLTRGIGETLDNMLDFLTGSTGSVTSATDTLNKQIDDLKKEIQSKTDRITAYEEKLRLQFIELETNMGRLQNQGSYLATQFAALTKSK